MEIIREREHKKESVFYWEFEYINSPGTGCSFECDANGNLLNKEHKGSLRKCLSNPELLNLGVVHHYNRYIEPAIGICEICGNEVVLDGFTCTCEDCGTDYNILGQRLAPRSQWGEETGEVF